MNYRPDISGLRAVAVVPVVLYHAGFSAISGGFIGVDIFFVISGFLITSDIIERIKNDTFSLVEFYHRRVRRIFPALFAMLGACFATAWFVLPPGEFISFSKSATAAALSGSNIFFYRNTDYFAAAAESLPLLHTWSLAVEEQFYLLWPLALMMLMAWLRPWALIVVFLLGVASIAAGQYLLPVNQAFVFYMLPTRAWELLLGGMIALPSAKAMVARLERRPAEITALAGLALIAASLFMIDSDTPFPGLSALGPCIGAAVVIAAGIRHQTAVSTALSVSPAAFVGLISYSLYLWHWPLLVFAGVYKNRDLFVSERVSIVIAALLISALSWRFVERPFRQNQETAIWTWAVPAASAMVVACCLSLVIIKGQGFPNRGPAMAPSVAAMMAERAKFQASPCLMRGALIPAGGKCLLGSEDTLSPTIVLWGDSHAAHLASSLDEAGKAIGVRVRQITKAGCAPLPELRMLPSSPMRAGCPAFNGAALKAILGDPNVSLVILAGRWNTYTGRGRSLLSRDGAWPSPDASRANFSSSIRATADKLAARGIKTAVVGPAPEPPTDVLDCLIRASFMRTDEAPCSTMPAGPHWNDNQLLSDLLPPSVQFIPIVPALCGLSDCRLKVGEEILYQDKTHFSKAGGHLLAPLFENAISSADLAVKLNLPPS
ncbi:acyltransferase [Mesorhizobium sp. M0306]|uniref:acyltransferase family protein n=1 Tax=Mesorhizobium sp. M0306 TaxID=2956932 RepID=UPI003337124B